ncbi:MAG: RES family NAD+ phosphorylase [Tistlia sp.]|uniref:RES family NAD+ phosphorylase n=1 Tax=Tistlia sp. TaxID=3057121 RepID=UPI0034A488F4
MRVWRLAKRRFARQLDGAGNRRTGARWNSPGRGLVYCSLCPSTCVLEAFVHLPPMLRRQLPEDFVFVELALPAVPGWLFRRAGAAAALPADLTLERSVTLPRRREAAARWQRRTGDDWLDRSGALFFLAPSAVVPLDWNVMLDPRHDSMKAVEVAGLHPFRFDERLVETY